MADRKDPRMNWETAYWDNVDAGDWPTGLKTFAGIGAMLSRLVAPQDAPTVEQLRSMNSGYSTLGAKVIDLCRTVVELPGTLREKLSSGRATRDLGSVATEEALGTEQPTDTAV